jgi:hypothetical protein
MKEMRFSKKTINEIEKLCDEIVKMEAEKETYRAAIEQKLLN